MNDPHVEALHYGLATDETTSFADTAPPVDYTDDSLTARLDAGRLTVKPTGHYATQEEAVQAVTPFVRAWEISSALRYKRPMVRFEFERAEIIDRNPPPPGPRHHVLSAEISSVIEMGSAVALHLTRGAYPAPPDGFAYDATVDTLYHRWTRYLDGAEPLQGMANFCRTVLVHEAGSREAAATRYGISDRVLRTLGRLATNTGDARTDARKMSANLRPLTGEERAWLEDAVRKIIERAGQIAAGPKEPLPQITLADLPPLGSEA